MPYKLKNKIVLTPTKISITAVTDSNQSKIIMVDFDLDTTLHVICVYVRTDFILNIG